MIGGQIKLPWEEDESVINLTFRQFGDYRDYLMSLRGQPFKLTDKTDLIIYETLLWDEILLDSEKEYRIANILLIAIIESIFVFTVILIKKIIKYKKRRALSRY